MRRPTPAEIRRALPQAAAPLVARLIEAADARGDRVYLVGGPVRDWRLGWPLRDVDLMVEPRAGNGAAELARAAAGEGVRVAAHDRFGTVTLREEKASVDLATARRESYASDGALPRVEPGTLEEDLLRRDFSANALALPVSAAARATHAGIVDPTGGIADIERRRLRVLHPRSFHDDPTRALRAGRLAPRLGFTLSRDTRAALRSALRDGAFGRVSGDRLRRELAHLFDDARLGLDPARALCLLRDAHVLGALEPGLGLEAPAIAPLRRLGRSLAAPPWPPHRMRPWLAGFNLWLLPHAPALRRRVLGRLSLRGGPAQGVAGFARRHESYRRALSRSRGRGAVDAALAGIEEEDLLALHALASAADRRRIARWAREDRSRRVPVSGDDLVELGLVGPAVGRGLRRLRTAWLDGAARSRDELLALARELPRGGSPRRRTRR